MSRYTVVFPEDNDPGAFPPYASIIKVLEHVAVQEDACGENNEVHEIKFLKSMDEEVAEIRLKDGGQRYYGSLRTRHIVARWTNGPFKQYLIWDSSKQDIVDMVEA